MLIFFLWATYKNSKNKLSNCLKAFHLTLDFNELVISKQNKAHVFTTFQNINIPILQFQGNMKNKSNSKLWA